MSASASSRPYVKNLLNIPLFQNLPAEEINRIATSVHQLTLTADKPLLQLGHKSEEVYFLLEGTVKVSVPQAHGGCIINICGPGSAWQRSQTTSPLRCLCNRMCR